MCHTTKIEYFGELLDCSEFSGDVDGVVFDGNEAGKRVAVLPDIYGMTDFYKGYASYVAGFGARTYLTNPWSEFGDLPEVTREAAYERRQKLKDREHCDRLGRGYAGILIAAYPLPWGMANQDEIEPAFEYMPALEKEVSILMGEADHLAGPDNIQKLRDIVAANAKLTMHLYEGSNHGFFTDIDGSDEKLRGNAQDAINKVTAILF
jgi:carboxymethylenebutenolidase